MHDEMIDKFIDLIKILYKDELEPVKLAKKICDSRSLSYDEKVDWLDSLADFCSNNYCSSTEETPADKVNDIAAYFQLTTGSLYNRFLDNEDGSYKYKTIVFKGKDGKTESLYFDTLEEAMSVDPGYSGAIIHKVFGEKEGKVTSTDIETMGTRFIYNNEYRKWIYDSYLD